MKYFSVVVIVSITVGGIGGTLLLAVIIWYIIYRRRQYRRLKFKDNSSILSTTPGPAPGSPVEIEVDPIRSELGDSTME